MINGVTSSNHAKLSGVVSVDLSAAFDLVTPDILLEFNQTYQIGFKAIAQIGFKLYGLIIVQ